MDHYRRQFCAIKALTYDNNDRRAEFHAILPIVQFLLTAPHCNRFYFASDTWIIYICLPWDYNVCLGRRYKLATVNVAEN